MAETEAPWGEAAENMRMQCNGFMIRAASDGYEIEGRKTAQSFATRIMCKLFGTKPVKNTLPNVRGFKR